MHFSYGNDYLFWPKERDQAWVGNFNRHMVFRIVCVYEANGKKKKKTDSKLWTILEIVSDGSHQRLEVHYII